VVIEKRGGFCYELNGLFYQLLKQLGYKVKMVSARVYKPGNGFTPEFDHMALIVCIDKVNYLVDVGFGEFAIHPLPIEKNKEIIDPRGVFIIEDYDEHYLVVKKKDKKGEFIPEYIFSQTERQMEDFREMVFFHQTSPESHFTQKKLCSIATSTGRITLTDNKLKITIGEEETIQEVETENDYTTDFFKYFGIGPRMEVPLV
jgi:N-hydroxyarylamine O-acetyltransferase